MKIRELIDILNGFPPSFDIKVGIPLKYLSTESKDRILIFEKGELISSISEYGEHERFVLWDQK